VQLGNDNTFGAVNDEGTVVGHVRDGTEVNVLDNSVEVFVIRIGAVQFEFRFERHRVCESSFQALFDGVTRRVDIVVEKFEDEAVAWVNDREILGKNLIETFVISLFWRRVELEEVMERLELNLQEVGVRKWILYRREIDTRFVC
jgi:hypothetical protein